MVYIINIFSSVFVVFVICSSYTYGPSTSYEPLWQSPPDVPHQNVRKTCIDWLTYSGFSWNDRHTNRFSARYRYRIFDPEYHVWASTYAYFVSSFSYEVIQQEWSTPQSFCNRFSNPNDRTPYLSLENANMSCFNWIYSFGYHIFDHELNKTMAANRKMEFDRDPHILVTIFSQYIVEVEAAVDTPSLFCRLLENSGTSQPDDNISYMTLNTIKTCEEWIILAGYSTHDGEYNILKAESQDPDVKRYQSKWTFTYISYLKNYEREYRTGCFSGLLRRNPEKPNEFCTRIGFPIGVGVNYDKELE